jgi:hypothetical protein
MLRGRSAAVKGEKPEIIFVLAPPRSFTSVTCAMLGQHPELYGVPELRLLVADSVGEWLQLCRTATYPMASGTLRAVSELVYGEQTDNTVHFARRWLRRHSHWTTRRLIRFLGKLVYPRILVDKSPNLVYSLNNLLRAYRLFPNASFLHLLRHPKGHGKSVLKLARMIEQRRGRPLPKRHWLNKLCSFPPLPQELGPEDAAPDPQRAWYSLNRNICEFLRIVPAWQQMAVRGEELLSAPDLTLPRIANWLGLRTDPTSIEAMKHPERSPYIGIGPKGASRGNDPFFLLNPALRTGGSEPETVEGPVSWHADRRELLPVVKELARTFGYR